MCIFQYIKIKIMAAMGDKSYCPIVTLFTKYADFSSCYITPNRGNHLYNPQEWALEALLENIIIRLSKVILPARHNTKEITNPKTISITTTTTCEDKDNIEGEIEETITDYRQPVYMYIELHQSSDNQSRRTILEKNVLFKPRNYDREDIFNMHTKDEIQNSAQLEVYSYGQVKLPKKQQQIYETAGADSKKVRFNLKPEIHVMRTWSFAYKAARKGEWHFFAVDRSRFQMRVHRAALYLNPIFTPEHRNKIYTSRFDE